LQQEKAKKVHFWKNFHGKEENFSVESTE